MSFVRALTPDEAADACGVTVEEWQADRLGVMAKLLAERSGLTHVVTYSPGEGLRPAAWAVYSEKMAGMMGLKIVRRFYPD